MKPIIAAFAAILFITFSAFTAQAIQVLLDGEYLDFDVDPIMMNDRTMVPMRRIFEALGAEIDWDDYTRTVTATAGETKVVAQIGNYVLTVNGTEIVLDVAPLIVDERTLVPARAVSESFDAVVDWIAETRTVTIATLGWRPARNPQEGELLGFGNNGYFELQYAARFWFEQEILPQMVFYNSAVAKEIIAAQDAERLANNVWMTWAEVAANIIVMDMLLLAPDLPNSEDLFLAAQHMLFSYGMDDHIQGITFEQMNGTTAAIIELRNTGWNLLATYIGITYSEGQGLRFFVLEQTTAFDGGGFRVSQITEDSRLEHSSIENERQAFAAAILALE